MTQKTTLDSNSMIPGEGLSKREQMKICQAIKICESNEAQEAKTQKRKGPSETRELDPKQRKLVKIDRIESDDKRKQLMSSPLESSEMSAQSPPKSADESSVSKKTFVNEKYQVPEGQGQIFNYILTYSYQEGEKKMEKQNLEWTDISNLGEELVSLNLNPNNHETLLKVDHKFKEAKDKIFEPFSKAHREFNQKYLKKEFLLQ